MSVLKSKRAESSIKFLDTAYDLELHTIKCCMKLPKRYTFFIGTELTRLAGKIPPEDLRASFVSWCGHISHCRSWRTKMAMEAVYSACMQKSTERFTPSTA